MTGGYVFSLSTIGGGEGVPRPGPDGGYPEVPHQGWGTPHLDLEGIPQPGPDGGHWGTPPPPIWTPPTRDGVPPIWTWMEGTPLPEMGYPPPPPVRTTEGVLTMRRAVCLLRSRRRTFLLVMYVDRLSPYFTTFLEPVITRKDKWSFERP